MKTHMGTTKVLSLTLEQAEMVDGLYAEEITSVEEKQSTNFIQKVKKNFLSGIYELRSKLGMSSKTPKATQTVTMLIKDPVQAQQNVKAEVRDLEQEAPKKTSDHEYKCYLNSVVFGE